MINRQHPMWPLVEASFDFYECKRYMQFRGMAAAADKIRSILNKEKYTFQQVTEGFEEITGVKVEVESDTLMTGIKRYIEEQQRGN